MRQWIFKLLFTLSFSLSVITCWGQNQDAIDSLSQVLNGDISGKEKVDVYLQLIKTYNPNDSLATVEYIESAKGLAEEINYSEGYLDALYEFAYLQRAHGDLAYSNHLFHQLIDSASAIHYKKMESKAYFQLGNIKISKGQLDSSLIYYEQARVIIEASGDSQNFTTVYERLGAVNLYLDHYAQALMYFLQTLDITLESDNLMGQASCYNNIGLIHERCSELPEALENYKKALNVFEQLDQENRAASCMSNIGTIYLQLDDLENALTYSTKALEIRKKNNDEEGMTISYGNIGAILTELGREDEAMENLTLALELASKNNMEKRKISPLLNIGNIHLTRQKYQLAKKYVEEALEIASRMDIPSSVKDAYFTLSEIEAALGNYQNAYQDHLLAQSISDSLLNQESLKKLTLMEANFEFENKIDSIHFENQLRQMANVQQVEKQKNIIFFVVIGLIALIIFGIVLFRKNTSIKSQADQLKRTNDRLYQLDQFKQGMTGMIVHDLKNPLNSIINLSGDNFAQQAGRQMLNMVQNILDVYKYEDTKMALNKTEQSILELANKAIQEVLFLSEKKSIRINNNINTEYSVLCDSEITERVFVNLLTNAIKYTPNNGLIELSTQMDDGGFLEVKVSDTGQGIAKENLEKVFERFGQISAVDSGNVRSTGLGLTFCKMAVEAHGGQIEVESEIGVGTTFSLTLPASKLKQEVTGENNVSPRDSTSIELSKEDKEFLKPFIHKLSELLVYQTTDIEQVLETIDSSGRPAVDQWVSEIRTCLFSMNDENYRILINNSSDDA